MTIRTLTLAVALLATVAVAVPGKIYTVRRGDTLNKISKKFGVSIEALKEANGLKSHTALRRGQSLTIPVSETAPAASQQTATITTAEITTGAVAPHAGPHEGSKQLNLIFGGGSMRVLDHRDGWIKVETPVGPGWLPEDSLKLTSVKSAPKPSPIESLVKSSASEPKEVAVVKSAASSNALLKRALAYQGVRYRWGGMSRSGVDCSGFTSVVFLSQGIKLPRTALQQSRIGAAVSQSDLQAGDLVFFRTNRGVRINHVGIYVGNRKFIHAATGGGHVMISDLDDKYYKRCYATARRVAATEVATKIVESSQEILLQ